jgi:hypothetical protein
MRFLPKDFAGFNFARDSLFKIAIDICKETWLFTNTADQVV